MFLFPSAEVMAHKAKDVSEWKKEDAELLQKAVSVLKLHVVIVKHVKLFLPIGHGS